MRVGSRPSGQAVAGSAARPRPIYLNLLAIRFPLPAVVSFLHRVSGVVLFLALPFALWLLEQSLGTQEGYARAAALAAHPAAKIVFGCLLWAYAHHLLAGLRLLAMDLGFGLERRAARRLSAGILCAGLAAAAALAGAWLW
ncbi:MAG: succinate dehydrogenase, cytochrome b556 subunit [Betaproteobacteria bacterium]|nr:succinate dehydrogenase, cytochrome b556 subunit [Betaproteobacteria bacterium]